MKSILVPFYFLFCSALLPAQIKTGMTFQAVVYHDDGRLLALKPIGIQFSFIREGTTLYSETHRPTTTLNGFVIFPKNSYTLNKGRLQYYRSTLESIFKKIMGRRNYLN